MTQTTAHYADIADVGGSDGHARIAPKASVFRRIADGLVAARRRRNGQLVAEFIQMRGGVLTDDLEREISRRFGHMAGEL